MVTSKSFSTISYNSKSFLTGLLDDMFNTGRIEFYCFIYHFAEGEVMGVPELKDHIHLFIIPSDRMDTIQLKSEFMEIDPNNDKPFTIINCVRSKFYDWFMYSLHDEKYLASKFETRKYHYGIKDCVCSDLDYLSQLLALSDNTKLSGSEKFVNLVNTGVSFSDLVMHGFVPIHLINQYHFAFNLIQENLRKQVSYEIKEDIAKLGDDVEPVDGKHNRKVFSSH